MTTRVERERMTPAAHARRSPRSALDALRPSPFSYVQRAAGNHGLQRLVQTKLAVSRPGDRYEQEADHVAEQVLQRTIAAPCACGGRCGACAAGTPQRKAAGVADTTVVDSPVASLGAGRPLDAGLRAFFEPRFGADLGGVRVHTGPEAEASARGLQARAYTVGRDLVFGPGEYAPATSEGQRLLAHELTHALQQRGDDLAGAAHAGGAVGDVTVSRVAGGPFIARQLSRDMCAEVGGGLDCDTADGTDTATGKNTLTIYADKEGSFLLIPKTAKVGHSWLKLTDASGHHWTYGFWPQEGFDASDPYSDVEGCVHHPDTAHRPTSSQTFELTDAQFAAARSLAVSICRTTPKYNLFGLQCTDFVRRVSAAAGQGHVGGFGLLFESPNALDSWIRSNALMLGASITAAANRGETGTGSLALDVTYTHQFYSALGNRLRLYSASRGELGADIKSLSTGVGAELTTQRIYLPSFYVYGGGIAGDLSPAGQPDRLGAGFTAGVGLSYKIDEFGAIGFDYNVVKDAVTRDPELHRLMISARLKLF